MHPGHSIAFNIFRHLVTCELDLRPFDLILIDGRGLVTFGDCSFSRFGFYRADRQTESHTQTDVDERLTPASVVCVSNAVSNILNTAKEIKDDITYHHIATVSL